MAYLVISLASPCSANYELNLKELEFVCKQVSEQTLKTELGVKPIVESGEVSSSNPSIKRDTTGVICGQVRASIITRRAVGNANDADNQCKSIVREVPADYLSKPNNRIAVNKQMHLYLG
jgi:hypothetical protein